MGSGDVVMCSTHHHPSLEHSAGTVTGTGVGPRWQQVQRREVICDAAQLSRKWILNKATRSRHWVGAAVQNAFPFQRTDSAMQNPPHTTGWCSSCCTVLSYKLFSFSLLFFPFSGNKGNAINTWNTVDFYMTTELCCRFFGSLFHWKSQGKPLGTVENITCSSSRSVGIETHFRCLFFTDFKEPVISKYCIILYWKKH